MYCSCQIELPLQKVGWDKRVSEEGYIVLKKYDLYIGNIYRNEVNTAFGNIYRNEVNTAFGNFYFHSFMPFLKGFVHVKTGLMAQKSNISWLCRLYMR